MKRFRKYRTDQRTRDEYSEVSLKTDDLIYPYFIVEGKSVKQEISSLKDVYHLSIDMLLKDIEEVNNLGINKILIFGVIDKSLKDEIAKMAYAPDNLVSRAVEAIKNKFPELIVITDVCLCGYTDHGHCGLVIDHEIDNDKTLPFLSRMAYTHAKAGADFVAPSAMMDGQVKAIRTYLDQNSLTNTGILSYSAKYASNFYGPFREAAQSAPAFGDRKTYQMDFRTIRQSLEEIKTDIEEGADWVMVKPAHTYLDIIQRAKQEFPATQLVAYQVSGEYMMIEAAADSGYFDGDNAMMEALTAIKRAGADKVITYYAKKLARILIKKNQSFYRKTLYR